MRAGASSAGAFALHIVLLGANLAGLSVAGFVTIAGAVLARRAGGVVGRDGALLGIGAAIVLLHLVALGRARRRDAMAWTMLAALGWALLAAAVPLA